MVLPEDVRKHIREMADFGARIAILHLIHHPSGSHDQRELPGLEGWRQLLDFITEAVRSLRNRNRQRIAGHRAWFILKELDDPAKLTILPCLHDNAGQPKPRRPNFILIPADDLGYRSSAVTETWSFEVE